MFYRTFFINPNTQTQCSIDDLYNGCIPNQNITDVYQKKTVRLDHIPFNWHTQQLTINTVLNNFFELNKNVTKEYVEYHIPKTKGGFRLISAPSEELKICLKNLLQTLERFGATAHDDAYAYVKDRTCLSALQQHKQKQTQWFYKFDLDNFFPSCTTQLLKTVLAQVYPFCILNEQNLNRLIDFATYKNALPQGSPLSPLLSNIVLTSFDWAMHYSIRHFKGVYTRYADDILISFPDRKDIVFLENIISNHLPTGLILNKDKSRCGSINGRNFNLGLVLNKERNITLGHKKKMQLKAKINNFIFDFTNRNFWSIIDTQVLQGEINYFKTIEPEYANFVIKRLEQKHHSQSLSSMFKAIITRRV